LEVAQLGVSTMGGGGGCCLEFRKGSSDFPKRQLGISDVE
jgi:hypothetical protein